MPVPELMTWIPSQRRWCKMHRGKRFYISARQLGCPETKEDSQVAANRWWRDKRAEIDSAYRVTARTPEPMEDIATAALASKGYDLLALARLVQRDFVAERLRRLAPLLSPEIRAAVEALFDADSEPAPEFIGQVIQGEVVPLLASAVKGEPLPADVAARLPPARVQQVESAAKELRGESTADPVRTVGALAGEWVQNQKIKASAGGMTPVAWNNLRVCLSRFVAFVGETADANTIDAERLERFHYFCLSKIAERSQDGNAGWSTSFAKEVFSRARGWVRWLWERGIIDPPANLNSRSFRFGSTAKKIPTWTIPEVQHVIGEAPGKLRLALLLMANAGMTQKDVSDLLDGEVDWSEGRITRQRSKTKGKANVPTVCYQLWPATFELLRKYRSGSERVLLTSGGKPYVSERIEKGKTVVADQFRHAFGQLRKRLNFHGSLKQLRKTSATLLESHEVYGRFTSLFLGHAPATVKDRHYAAPPQKLFDEAVLWLGRQLGFVDAEDAPPNAPENRTE